MSGCCPCCYVHYNYEEMRFSSANSGPSVGPLLCRGRKWCLHCSQEVALMTDISTAFSLQQDAEIAANYMRKKITTTRRKNPP